MKKRTVLAAGIPLMALAVTVYSTVTAAGSSAAAQSLPAAISNPAARVNPFTGTYKSGAVEGNVSAFPGAALPFGMIQWSPDTTSRPAGGGYYYSDSRLVGFSLTHVSGPGCAVAGAIPVLPLAGGAPASPTNATASFAHSSEYAHPGYYAVTAGGVNTQLAVTERSGVGQFIFPANSTARLLLKTQQSDSGAAGSTVARYGSNEVIGSVTTGNFCHNGSSNYTTYFAARFNRSFSGSTWIGANKQLGGADLDFGSTASNRTLGMQVAISYVSTGDALANLTAEAHTWSVATVAAQAISVWNNQLGMIGIGGGSANAQEQFYTALYHASLSPSVSSDDNGNYLGFDGKVHQVAAGHAQYADYSGWDIYRSEVPLITTIDPKAANDMATSLLNDAAQGGSLPRWALQNGDTGIMNGDSADPILADFYAFGAHSFNVSAAVADMVKGADGATSLSQGSKYPERPNAAAYIADGYVPNVAADSGSALPNGASETLEYALDDFAISQLAEVAGDSADAATFSGRSHNWANLFDTANGYIEPRDASGAFPAGAPVQDTPGKGQNGFEEGNAAQYTWMVPQDLAGLISDMGGDQAAVARLNTFFTQLNVGPDEPYAWQGNEAGLDTPWVYDSAGEPWLTQALVKRITSQLYSLTPGGEPGNDDLGSLSSWYVWSVLGLYPQTPGVTDMVLGTPQFPLEVIHDPWGALTITASGAGDTYVSGLTVNGVSSQSTYVQIAGGAKQLAFTLSTTPNTSWGSAAADAPPSFGPA
jgi:predicted alpha-1,2-mannosidase